VIGIVEEIDAHLPGKILEVRPLTKQALEVSVAVSSP